MFFASEYYDVNDPFIDDSELAIDERTYFAQTKQQGFYVSSGEVALLKDKSSPKKPKPKKHQPEASSSSSSHTHLAPSSSITGKSKDLLLTAGSMPLSDIDEGDASSRALPPYGSLGLLGHVLAKDRKRYTTVVENGKKKKVVDVASFHPELREAIGALKGAY
ncbi:hypothetical protein ONZ45_g8762 [Pleurotus djamor]|nr:hypothetical protein ONZ45_g8762 [Pleurotus djamor]